MYRKQVNIKSQKYYSLYVIYLFIYFLTSIIGQPIYYFLMYLLVTRLYNGFVAVDKHYIYFRVSSEPSHRLSLRVTCVMIIGIGTCRPTLGE